MIATLRLGVFVSEEEAGLFNSFVLGWPLLGALHDFLCLTNAALSMPALVYNP